MLSDFQSADAAGSPGAVSDREDEPALVESSDGVAGLVLSTVITDIPSMPPRVADASPVQSQSPILAEDADIDPKPPVTEELTAEPISETQPPEEAPYTTKSVSAQPMFGDFLSTAETAESADGQADELSLTESLNSTVGLILSTVITGILTMPPRVVDASPVQPQSPVSAGNAAIDSKPPVTEELTAEPGADAPLPAETEDPVAAPECSPQPNDEAEHSEEDECELEDEGDGMVRLFDFAGVRERPLPL
jgi:hypothetical protein